MDFSAFWWWSSELKSYKSSSIPYGSSATFATFDKKHWIEIPAKNSVKLLIFSAFCKAFENILRKLWWFYCRKKRHCKVEKWNKGALFTISCPNETENQFQCLTASWGFTRAYCDFYRMHATLKQWKNEICNHCFSWKESTKATLFLLG